MAYQDLRKNPADKRLAFVWPSLDNEQKLTVLDVVFNAIGIDDWRQEFHFRPFSDFADLDKPDNGDNIFRHFADRLAVNTIVDAYIPWLAKVVKRGLTRDEEDALKRRFLSICMWAKKTNTDLSRVSLADALESARSHITKAGRKGKVESDANPVVYRFDDGFKIVQLKTDAALKLEGTLLKHCVGTYCDQVREGTSIIYSLRTPSNEPLVTLEYQPKAERFIQMFGLENEAPEPSEQPYLIEFVETNFPHDKMGLFMAGKPPKDIDFRDANLTAAHLEDADLEGAHLEDADLKYAYLTNAILRGAHLEGADLRGANLEYADLTGAHLEGANLEFARLYEAHLKRAHLEGANLRGANLIDANLKDAHLTDVKYDGDTAWPAGFAPPIDDGFHLLMDEDDEEEEEEEEEEEGEVRNNPRRRRNPTRVDEADEVDDWVTIEECDCHTCAPARMNPRAPKRTATGAYADLDSVTLVITNALANYGLSMNNILAVKFTRGGKSRGGACSYSRSLNKCQIMFNGLAWPAFTEAQRLNTVLHEAAHAIQFLTTGTSDHGPKWQQIAQSIGCSGDSCMTLEASQAMVDAYAEAKGLEKRKIITREEAEAARSDFAVGDYVSFEHKRERWFGKIVSRGPMHATVMMQSPSAGITGKIPYPSLQKEAPPRFAEKVAGVDKPAPGESLSAWQARTGRGRENPDVEFDEYEYTIGKHWVYALAYGEDDSLTPEEEENLQRFLRRVPGYGTRSGHWQVFDEDAGFGRDPISGLGSDRATVVWMVEKPGMTDLEADLEPDELRAFEDMISSRYKIHDFPESTAEEARVAIAFREAVRNLGGDLAFKAVKAVPVWHTTEDWADQGLRRTGIMLTGIMRTYEDGDDVGAVINSEAWQELERSMGAHLGSFTSGNNPERHWRLPVLTG